MDKEWKEETFISSFLFEFAKIFTFAILVMVVVAQPLASLIDPDLHEVSVIFAPFGNYLPYSVIYQFAGFAFIMAAVSKLLFSGLFFTRIRILYKYFLFSLSTLLTVSLFAFVFKWFPVDNIQAWMGFVLCVFFFFGAAIGLSLLLLRLDDKKYNKLLKEYKARHKIDQ